MHINKAARQQRAGAETASRAAWRVALHKSNRRTHALRSAPAMQGPNSEGNGGWVL